MKKKSISNKSNDVYASLYFNILYIQIRNLKDTIISVLGSLSTMYEQALIGHTYKSLETDDILRAKLKKISQKFKLINDNLIDSSTAIDELLDLYEGFGVSEVYEADTGKIRQQ